jgi:hypothetical protein
LLDDQGARWIATRKPDQSPIRLKPSALPRTKGDLIPRFIDTILQNEPARKETQGLFDVMNILNACERSLRSGRQESVHYR